mgnify:CR=1 FL=1
MDVKSRMTQSQKMMVFVLSMLEIFFTKKRAAINDGLFFTIKLF